MLSRCVFFDPADVGLVARVLSLDSAAFSKMARSRPRIINTRANSKAMNIGTDVIFCTPEDNAFKDIYEELLFLNASPLVSAAVLGRRYSKEELDWKAEKGFAEARTRRSAVHKNVVKQCIYGADLGLLAYVACEGYLMRKALSCQGVSCMFGYLEAWLCVASRLLPAASLKPLFDVLPGLYCAITGDKPKWDEEGAEERKAKTTVKEAYGIVCVLAFEARAQLPEWCYRLRDSDVDWIKFPEEDLDFKVRGVVMYSEEGESIGIDLVTDWLRRGREVDVEVLASAAVA